MNIGALTVGGIPNNSKEFKNILMPGVRAHETYFFT